MRTVGLILASFALACSCISNGSGAASIKPASKLQIIRLDSNILPLKASECATDANGFTIRFAVQSSDCFCNSTPFFVCNRHGHYNVSVNGKAVNPMAGIHVLNGEDCCFNVSGILREGSNEIVLSGEGKMPQAYISGDFNVEARDGEWWAPTPSRALELGSLAAQGMPFYFGQVAYVQKFEVPEKVGRRTLSILDWSGASCEVWINDRKIADVVGKPYIIKVGPYLVPGQNSVEIRITGQRPSNSGEMVPSDLGLLKGFTIE